MRLPIDYNDAHWKKRRDARNEYVKLQKGLCYHCNKLLTESPSGYINSKVIYESMFPKGFFNYPVHLHHDHDTGMTIGAVHNKCNAVLWQYHGE